MWPQCRTRSLDTWILSLYGSAMGFFVTLDKSVRPKYSKVSINFGCLSFCIPSFTYPGFDFSEYWGLIGFGWSLCGCSASLKISPWGGLRLDIQKLMHPNFEHFGLNVSVTDSLSIMLNIFYILTQLNTDNLLRSLSFKDIHIGLRFWFAEAHKKSKCNMLY